MKPQIRLAVCLVVLLIAIGAAPAANAQFVATAEAYFSPGQAGTLAIIRELDAATSSVHVLAYQLTDPLIAQAIQRAAVRVVSGRPLDVRVLLDDSEEKDSSTMALWMINRGVWVGVDAPGGPANNNLLIIDGGVVIVSSSSFTSSAATNPGNLLVLRGATLAAAYEANFALLTGHGRAYAYTGAVPPPPGRR